MKIVLIVITRDGNFICQIYGRANSLDLGDEK